MMLVEASLYDNTRDVKQLLQVLEADRARLALEAKKKKADDAKQARGEREYATQMAPLPAQLLALYGGDALEGVMAGAPQTNDP
jgi:hypothetical protein